MTIVSSFQSTLGQVDVGLAPGSVTLIAGPNGVGKSALLDSLYRSLPLGIGTYLPGHRQINLNQGVDTLGQDILQMRTNFYNAQDAFSRYRGAWGEDQFKATLRTLVNAEHAFNRDFRTAVAGEGEKRAKTASFRESPIDQLNVIFSHAGLPVNFVLTSNGLTAEKAGSRYSVEALSDGERASLFLVAAILGQDAASVLLIDEPEKHLHPSITGLLLETALRARPDIAVVVSSHDMSLIERLAVHSTIYVKESQLISIRPERRIFDVELIPESYIPEQLRIDILGARSRILYVEGTRASRDAALYAHVYPGWKLISKGGAEKVIESSRGIRDAEGVHWLTVAGLVDGDGRNAAEVAALKTQGVFVLPNPTVENLFFYPEAQRCFVAADEALRGGASLEERLAALATAIKDSASATRDNIIARRTVWRTQREIASQPLTVKHVREGSVDKIEVNIADIKNQVATEVDAVLSRQDAQEILTALPIKNTDLPEIAAKALGASSFHAYCQVIQRQIDLETETGKQLVAALRAQLPLLDVEQTTANGSQPVAGPRSIGVD